MVPEPDAPSPAGTHPRKRSTRREFLWTGSRACLATSLAAGFLGCSRDGSSPSGSASPPGSSLKGRRVGISSPHRAEILHELFEDMKREAAKPEHQVEVVVVDAANDAVKQLADIEAFIAQGYDAIFFLALPSPGLEKLVAQATAKGIAMFNHGASPITGSTQNIMLDQKFSGAEIGRFAGRWIQEKHGGQAEVGVLGNTSDPWLQIRTQGLKDGLREAAPGARIVGEVHGHSIELGAAGAANLLQAHPGIRVLLAHADDPGFGCYTAAMESGRRDPAQFLVASCDGTRLVMDKISEGGIYRASWSYLFPLSATAAMRDIIRALRGEKVSPTRTQVGRLVTQSNVEEIRTIARDPQAPAVQQLYQDPTIMRFSEERLTTPKS